MRTAGVKSGLGVGGEVTVRREKRFLVSSQFFRSRPVGNVVIAASPL